MHHKHNVIAIHEGKLTLPKVITEGMWESNLKALQALNNLDSQKEHKLNLLYDRLNSMEDELDRLDNWLSWMFTITFCSIAGLLAIALLT